MSLDALQDLFARVRGGETGVWRLGQDPQRTIFLEKGLIVFAQSTHPLDRLTHLLVEKGKLTQAQMDYAMENLAPGLSIGRNLIQMGFITQRDLLDVAKFQVERVVSGVLGSEGISADFQAKELDPSVVRLTLDTFGMLLGGLLNLRDRERMLGLLGPLDQALELLTAPPEASLPSDLVKAPPLFDGQRTLLDLAREAGIEPMRLGALALFLKEMQWARGGAPALPAPSDGVASVGVASIDPFDEVWDEVQATPVVVEAPGLDITLALAPPTAAQPQTSTTEPRAASLIEHIQAAALPTANLEHMAEQLDRLSSELRETPPIPRPIEPMIPVEPGMLVGGTAPPDPQRLPPPQSPPLLLVAPAWVEIPPAAKDQDEITAENIVPIRLPETHGEQSWHVEEGQALLPEPVNQVPFSDTLVEDGPPVTMEPLDPDSEALPSHGNSPIREDSEDQARIPEFGAAKPQGRGPLWAGLGLLAVLGLGAWWMGRPQGSPVPQAESQPPIATREPATGVPPAQKPAPSAVAVEPEPARPQPSPKGHPDTAPPPPVAKVAKAPAPGASERWASLRNGKLDQAFLEGRSHLQSLKADRWTIRLEIACQVETLRNAAGWIEGRSKDIFALPMAMKNGQTCTQLFHGSFGTQAEAEAEIPRLPVQFREGGNKPRVFRISEIPSRQ